MARDIFPEGSDVKRVVSNALATDVTPAVVAADGLLLVGYTARESAGTPAAASFNLQNAAAVDVAQNVVVEELALDTSKQGWFWPGIPCPSGITIDRVTGTTDIVVFYAIMPIGRPAGA